MKSVGVIAYDLAHNAAGRAHNLAQMYARFTDVELVGPVFAKFGNDIWPPIKEAELPVKSFFSDDPTNFVEQARALVESNPYKVVHLSKPRLPNLIFAALYQQVWGSKLIMDVDDEEMAFVNAEEPLNWGSFIQENELPGIDRLHGKVWTQLAAGLVPNFDAVTVSNPALQKRYGGEVVPHTRDEAVFSASPENQRSSRETYGISQEATVVLYSGTPRKHKGLLDTAKAIDELAEERLKLVVVGDFPDADLRRKLIAAAGPYLQLIPGQPMGRLADVSAVADIVVLLQDKQRLVAQYQLPAKLVDALASGSLVLMSFTDATEHLRGQPGILEVDKEHLTESLLSCLAASPDFYRKCRLANREAFETMFSFAAVAPKLKLTVDSVLSKKQNAILDKVFNLLLKVVS